MNPTFASKFRALGYITKIMTYMSKETDQVCRYKNTNVQNLLLLFGFLISFLLSQHRKLELCQDSAKLFDKLIEMLSAETEIDPKNVSLIVIVEC